MQIDDEVHREEVERRYGPWPWITGLAFAGFIAWLMETFAKSF